jgi:hypothetical protein
LARTLHNYYRRDNCHEPNGRRFKAGIPPFRFLSHISGLNPSLELPVLTRHAQAFSHLCYLAFSYRAIFHFQ